MRHGLLAIDVFSCENGSDNDFLVPVIRHSRDNAVDFPVVQKFLVASCCRDAGTDDFLGQAMSAVIKVTRSNAFDSRQLNGISEQIGTLHANADNAESYAVAGRHLQIAACFEARVFEKHALCGRHSHGRTCTALEEFPPGEIFYHCLFLPSSIDEVSDLNVFKPRRTYSRGYQRRYIGRRRTGRPSSG